MEATKIMTLMGNLMDGRKDFTAEHGLSLYVEAGHTHILFDFGTSMHTFENRRKIKMRPDRTDFAVCSHGHYDHGGGYKKFVKNGLQYSLMTGRRLFTEGCAVSGIESAYLGPGSDQGSLTENRITHTECCGLTPLIPDCWAIDDIRRTYEFEPVLGRFVSQGQDTWTQNKFCDETCLIIEEQGELVVIVNCSHPGILNILTMIRKHFSQLIETVIGGTHLMETDGAQIRQTVEVVRNMGIRLLGLNHCSGGLFRDVVKREGTLSTVYLGAGDCPFLTQGYPQWTGRLISPTILETTENIVRAALPMVFNKCVTLIQFSQ